MPNFRDCKFICCVVNKECCGCCIMGANWIYGCDLFDMNRGLEIGADRPGSAWLATSQTGPNNKKAASRRLWKSRKIREGISALP